MRIVDLSRDDERAIREVAALLVSGFAEHYPEVWKSALKEVHESLSRDRLSLLAIDEAGTILGWVGGIPQHDGRVWELHPIVVAGRASAEGHRASAGAKPRGSCPRPRGPNHMVGTDDEDDQTSLSGVDLYDDLLGRIANIRNLREHPYEFYQRLGYTIAGVMPDANGFGKPDIFMAKRIAPAPTWTGR